MPSRRFPTLSLEGRPKGGGGGSFSFKGTVGCLISAGADGASAVIESPWSRFGSCLSIAICLGYVWSRVPFTIGCIDAMVARGCKVDVGGRGNVLAGLDEGRREAEVLEWSENAVPIVGGCAYDELQ